MGGGPLKETRQSLVGGAASQEICYGRSSLLGDDMVPYRR